MGTNLPPPRGFSFFLTSKRQNFFSVMILILSKVYQHTFWKIGRALSIGSDKIMTVVKGIFATFGNFKHKKHAVPKTSKDKNCKNKAK